MHNMASLPSLRVTGHRVWSRIRRTDHTARDRDLSSQTAADAKLQALRIEVERVASARSGRERAAQLARVLQAVSVLAEAHGLSQADLEDLRAGRSGVIPGLKRHLKRRARGVVAQVWNVSGSLATRAVRGQKALGLTPGSIATALLKRQLSRAPRLLFANRRPKRARTGWLPALRLPGLPLSGRARAPYVVRVGGAGRARGPQLIAASLLHLPRLQRQIMALGRSAVALRTATLVRLPTSPINREHVAAAGLLLRSGRSGLQLTYEVATAGAQLFLRSYVFPRVLRYLSAGLSTGVALREVAPARVLPPR
jgi:hypothetical protein